MSSTGAASPLSINLVAWYTKGARPTGRLSYFQTAVTLCSPFRETESTAYSGPSRKLWART